MIEDDLQVSEIALWTSKQRIAKPVYGINTWTERSTAHPFAQRVECH